MRCNVSDAVKAFRRWKSGFDYTYISGSRRRQSEDGRDCGEEGQGYKREFHGCFQYLTWSVARSTKKCTLLSDSTSESHSNIYGWVDEAYSSNQFTNIDGSGSRRSISLLFFFRTSRMQAGSTLPLPNVIPALLVLERAEAWRVRTRSFFPVVCQ